MREQNSVWAHASLGSLVESAVDGPFGSHLKSAHYVEEPGVRLVRLQNIGVGEFDDSDRAWISEKHAQFLRRHDVRAGDVLVASLGDENHPFGRACVYPRSQAPGIVKADCFRLRLTADAEPGFLSGVMNCTALRASLNGLAQGVTRDRVNLGNLLRFKIPLPPIAEQRQIAAVLDTLDEAIRKTAQLIAKLKQVKQGLLRDLLTRGVDDNGELRDPERHPEQFKGSVLGRIPKDWQVTALGNVSDFVTSGSRGWAGYYADSGALFIRIGNLTREHINLRYDSVQFVRPPANSEGKRTVLAPGDLLISITADLGIIGVVPEGLGEAYVNQHIALLRIRPDAANSRWLGHYMTSKKGQHQILRLDDQGAKAGLNLPTVRALLCALPRRPEQDEITIRLDAIDHQVARERVAQGKLRLLKAGLMEDLLTGRVRVTSLLEDANP